MRENKAYRFPLCHAIVSHNVVASVCTDHQLPSQAQLKSPFGDSCCYYYSFITFQSRTRRFSQRYSTQDMMISDHFQSQTNYALLRTVLIKKGDIFLLEEQHENFVAAETKCEMQAATNQFKVKMSGSEKKGTRTRTTFPPLKVFFWKFHVVVVQNNGKEMYRKSLLHLQCCFFAN